MPKNKVYIYFLLAVILGQSLLLYYFNVIGELDAQRDEEIIINNLQQVREKFEVKEKIEPNPQTINNIFSKNNNNNNNDINNNKKEEKAEETNRINNENNAIKYEKKEIIEPKEAPIINVKKEEEKEHKEKEIIIEIDTSRIPQKGAVELGAKMKESTDTTIRNSDLLHVFVIPHTHCDAGWLKTFEQYYRDEVSKILTTMTSALANKKHRKFGWVEIGFLDKWWVEQSDDTKNLFRKLIKDKQIEIVMGGWVSSDEATVTYMQSINQLTEGHRYLQEKVDPNIVPKIGWQIDPFGLSKVTPSLFSQMCFDGHVAWRISEPTMKDYLGDKSLEFVWRSSQSLGSSSDILMHLLPWGYEAPGEFLFENTPMLPIKDAVEIYAQKLAGSFKSRAEHYDSGLLMWLWGHDFRFFNSHAMFDTMDLLIDEINAHPEIYHCKVEYGTPSDYFSKLNTIEKRFEMRDKDYLPYWAGPVNWWTGYYTSRPKLKQFCRYLDHFQRSSEAIFAIARLISPNLGLNWEDLFEKLESVRKVQGVMQHHDAITGTMREIVHEDYWNMMYKSDNNLKEVVKDTAAAILFDSNQWKVELTWRINAQEATVALFNSLGWEREDFVSINVFDVNYIVKDLEGNIIDSEILFDWDNSINNIGYKLYFKATVPALGYRNYFISKSQRSFKSTTILHSNDYSKEMFKLTDSTIQLIQSTDFYIENDKIKIIFDKDGNLKQVEYNNNEQMKLEQSFYEYGADSAWDNHYTFKSTAPPVKLSPQKSNIKIVITKTPLVQEIARYYHDRIKQIIRIYKGFSYIEMEDIVGAPVKFSNFVTRFSTDLITSKRFYTDDSGLEMIERNYDDAIPVYGNYYPMIYSCYIREYRSGSKKQLTYVSTNAHGVTSGFSGELEVMLHRNSPQRLANGEPMDDQTVVRLRSYLLFTPEDNDKRQVISMLTNFPLLPIFIYENQSKIKHEKASFLSQPLPDAVHLTNYQFHNQSSKYLAARVNHLRQNDLIDTFDGIFNRENPIVVLDLVKTLSNDFFKVNSIEERTLSLNSPPDDCLRYHWHDRYEEDHPSKYGDLVSYNNTSPNFSIKKNGFSYLLPLSFHSYFVNFTPAV